MPEAVQVFFFSKYFNIGKHRVLDSAREKGLAPKPFDMNSALRNESNLRAEKAQIFSAFPTGGRQLEQLGSGVS